jgi:hypothetical protein
MKGGRKLSNWNLFVKKVYKEGKASDPDYEFKQALSDASKRKSEMNVGQGIKTRKAKKGSRRLALAGGKSRRRRRH